MARYAIVWTANALEDRRSIFKYWNKRNRSTRYALKLQDEIEMIETLICKDPLIGLQSNILNTYSLLVSRKFRLVYEIYGENILILAFWDARQNPDKLSGRLKK